MKTHDLEGLVAKRKDGKYRPETTRRHKLLNAAYSQKGGRADLFQKISTFPPLLIPSCMYEGVLWRCVYSAVWALLMDSQKEGEETMETKNCVIGPRIEALQLQLERLLISTPLGFGKECSSGLPHRPGVYRIFDLSVPDDTMRAGGTAASLWQRVYQNHLMGNQSGNLRAQMVQGGVCSDLEAGKRLMRDRLAVQVLIIEDERERVWFELFMLGVLRPRFCDRS